MKNKKIILASVLAFSLCLTACEKSPANSGNSSGSHSSNADSSSSSSIQENSSLATSGDSITGFLGETIYTDNAYQKDEYMMRFNYFGYIRYASPVFENTLKTPDLFNLDTYECPKYDGKLTQKNPEWITVKPGDVLENGLKVKTTECVFEQFIGDNGEKKFEHSQTVITFEGDLTVEGVLICAGKEDVYVTPGNLFFVPDTTKSVKIPVVPFFSPSDRYDLIKFIFDDNGFVTDGMYFIVGSLESVSVNLDGIKKGQAKNVKVTLTDIKIGSGYTASAKSSATIKAIEIL